MIGRGKKQSNTENEELDGICGDSRNMSGKGKRGTEDPGQQLAMANELRMVRFVEDGGRRILTRMY